MYTLLELESKTFGELKKIGDELNVLPKGDRRRRQSWIDAIAGVNPPLLQLLEVSPGVEVDRVQEPVIEPVESPPAAESEQVQEPPLESKFGRIVYPKPAQGAIVPAAKKHLEEESDLNPILTGLTFSANFLARYAPPQSESIHYKVITDGSTVDSDGQLNLLDVQVVTEPEPPDPDDFESLDAFRKAITRWDWEHPTSSFDHCSDLLPNSVHCEPPNPEDFDSMFAFWAAYDAWDEASNDDPEPLETSLDSFCEWAPCPADWYEQVALDGSSKVLEMSPGSKSSITSDFFILTFDRWGDRLNRDDEPPDTGTLARWPKPKPPTFPPQASQPKSAQVSPSQPGIPKLFHSVAAGSSTQPARSPPGGDA